MKKILIIRFSSIGDIVLTTPVLRCLKQQLPGVEIHYLTKKQFEPVLKSNPYIDKIWTLDKSVSSLIRPLRRQNFDEIIDLHYNLRSSKIRALLRKPYSKFNKLNTEKWLLVNFRINLLPKVHIVERYLQAVKHLGVVSDNKGLDYFISSEDEIDINTLRSEGNKGDFTGYVAFAIGGQHATKRLPDEMIISICRKINSPVILLGGKEDAKTAEKIAAFTGKEKIYNACGKYNLNQSASLVRQARKVITHDTGLMHIAAAFKKDIISVWGNTVPEFGMYPYMAGAGSKIFEVKNLPCRPCSKLGFSRCPQKHFYCMKLHNTDEIAEAVNL